MGEMIKNIILKQLNHYETTTNHNNLSGNVLGLLFT